MLLKLLIADDNRDAADSLAMVTAMWGHEARAVYAADAVLQALPEFVPDALIVDLAMPKKSGLEIIRPILEMPDRPALLGVSGYGNHYRQAALDAGFDCFFEKPVPLDQLQRLLTAMAEAAALSLQSKDLRQRQAQIVQTTRTLAAELNAEIERFNALRGTVENSKRMIP